MKQALIDVLARCTRAQLHVAPQTMLFQNFKPMKQAGLNLLTKYSRLLSDRTSQPKLFHNSKQMKKGLVVSLALLFISIASSASAQELSGKEIVQKADDKWQGATSQSEMTMTIVRPTWQRTIKMKNWTKGRDHALTLVTAPAKEKGQTFLKRETEMWNWSPKISRLIKLPPAMLSQGWMGSDFSNDDMLKESSIVVDYNHKIVGSETMSGKDCYKIELIPKEDAAVVWGKIEMWISKGAFDQLKAMYYDEEMYLVKTHTMSDIKKMHDREIPTRIEIIPEDEPGNKTIVVTNKQIFDKPMKDAFFSKQNMKRIR